jgi:Domain of unknown function (DUF4430)
VTLTIRTAIHRSSPTLILLALLAVVAPPTVAQESSQTVRLTIDYGDGVEKSFTRLDWKEKMTVFDALQAAEKHERGIKLKQTGSGETIFITAIDDAENEGQGGRNWRYSVNDKPARMSAGVAELKAGDTVVWRYRQ